MFVVEQQCAFQEIDGLDPVATHWWSPADDGGIAAYLRVLDEGGGVTRIGRVVTAPEHRGTGAGADLVRAALETIDGPTVLGAQVGAQGFYERLGYAVDGPAYDEDGIPHVPMRRPGP